MEGTADVEPAPPLRGGYLPAIRDHRLEAVPHGGHGVMHKLFHRPNGID